MEYRRSLVWLRRDLRLDDHAVLAEACRRSDAVALAFVLDPGLLRGGELGPPIVQSFFSALAALREDLRGMGGDLVLLEGDFADELGGLAERLGCDALFRQRETDPRLRARDEAVERRLRAAGRAVHVVDDLTYFTPEAVRQTGGKPYAVFTPYKNRWLARREEGPQAPYGSRAALAERLLPAAELGASREVPTPEAYGHASSSTYPTSGEAVARRFMERFLAEAIDVYKDGRNLPARPGTSRLSPQLRAGTIGVRRCVETAFAARRDAPPAARTHIDVWISELVWREFYHQVLATSPHVVDEPYDARARRIAWRDDDARLEAWREGRTGYPLVDAAMRQLRSIGWMHNRLRMVVASFLTKDLLIDYRRGEAHFIHWLADGDTAANNGGWQWASSTGVDAAPYFRVFNPVTQSRTYDPDGEFLRMMLPELRALPNAAIHAPWTASPETLRRAGVALGVDYPAPIVDHAAARDEALAVFGAAFKQRPDGRDERPPA